jgi:hypothetical protein
MRHILGSCVVVAFLAAAPAGASAQTIVDLSKPQTGKSRFVLKPDMTPADLGRVEEEKAVPVAALSRVPACGEGCKMEQPELPREQQYGYRDDPNTQRTRSGTRVIFITNVNGSQPQQAAAGRRVSVNAHTRKDGTQVGAHTRSAPSFSFRRRR